MLVCPALQHSFSTTMYPAKFGVMSLAVFSCTGSKLISIESELVVRVLNGDCTGVSVNSILSCCCDSEIWIERLHLGYRDDVSLLYGDGLAGYCTEVLCFWRYGDLGCFQATLLGSCRLAV